MSKIKAHNVLKIVDVFHTSLTSNTIAFLNEQTDPTYKDQVLNEHIYNIADISEEYDGEDENILTDFTELQSLVNKTDSGYIRIVYS